MACLRPFGAPVLLVAACVMLVSVPLYWEYAWCTGIGATLALVGSFALTRGRLLAALRRARFGWCGALPVQRGEMLVALLLLVATALGVAAGAGSLLLLVAAAKASQPDAIGLALLALDGGLVLGTGAAVVSTSRKDAVERLRHADGIREPLFALSWLNGARLPHLSDWQRRAAVVGWRRGGSFAMVGCVLAAVPDGAAIPAVVGMVLWMLALVWFEVVLRASAATTVDAMHLLDATPLSPDSMRRATLRYPFFAAVCAVVVVVVGVALPGGGLLSGVAWTACAVAAAALPLHRIVKATSGGDRA